MSKKFPKPYLWEPKNPDKYVGDISTLTIRSALEKRFALWCDRTESIIKWSSEELVIPYLSPVDSKFHRYFVDFQLTILDKSNEIQHYWVEIKPLAQTQLPIKPKRMTAKANGRYSADIETFVVNQAKWEAATRSATLAGAKFLVITEKDLGM